MKTAFANSFNNNYNKKNTISFQANKAVYLCSPLASGFVATPKIPTIKDFINKNMKKALTYAKKIAEKNDFPYWNHSTWPNFIDDTDPKQREFAMSGCIDLLKRCDMLVYFKEPKGGMIKEISESMKSGIPVLSAKQYQKLSGDEIDKLVENSDNFKKRIK